MLEEFEIPHTAAGFQDSFARVEASARRHAAPVAVAMEGHNGHVRPLDSLVKARGWQLFIVNNLKLARFKEIFPAAAKSDRIDTGKTLELIQLRDHLPMAGEVLQEVMATPKENDILKRLSRRRRRLVNERGRVLNSLQADLQAVAPGLLQITWHVGNLWFLNFLTCLLKLARVRRVSLLTDAIQAWQSRAFFAPDASLDLYLGMATLDRSSGKFRGSKLPKHVNTRAKAAMMTAVYHHRKRVPQSQRYYEKKRAEGKTHNQVIRALGRHVCRVIFKMLSQDRPYRIDP